MPNSGSGRRPTGNVHRPFYDILARLQTTHALRTLQSFWTFVFQRIYVFVDEKIATALTSRRWISIFTSIWLTRQCRWSATMFSKRYYYSSSVFASYKSRLGINDSPKAGCQSGPGIHGRSYGAFSSYNQFIEIGCIKVWQESKLPKKSEFNYMDPCTPITWTLAA